MDDATLAGLFTTRGICHGYRWAEAEAAAYFREAARLAGQAGDTCAWARALLNLSDAVTGTDPAAGAEAARDAAAHLRRAGARNYLASAVMNLAQALLMTGDWDTAEAELAQAIDADGLAGIEHLACYRAWLAALRGDAPTAQAALAALGDLRASEDPQDQANIAVAEAFTAAARHQPAAALRHARAALAHAGALGISHEYLRWAWPLAARAAHDLADTATTGELLALLDGYQPGQLAPMQRAERDLARARLAAADGDPAPARRSPPRSPGCASTPPPTTWPTACSTTPPTSPPTATPQPPRLLSAKPAASPSGCAASRWWTARTPSSPPGPAPRPRDDRIRQPRASPPPRTRPLSPTASTPWECHAAQPLRSYPGAPTRFEPHSTATTADPGGLFISNTARCHRFRCQHFHSCACGLRHARWPSATVAIRQKSPQAHPADDARAVRARKNLAVYRSPQRSATTSLATLTSVT